jgi:UDP-GlcNAc:undecaprenyl-phosphate GlcNAc-1-phosphate transferase
MCIVYGFHDIPEERKVHTQKVPTMGGLAIFIAVWCTVLLVDVSGIVILENIVYKILAVSLGFFLVGIVDDVKGISAKTKFLVQLISGAVFFSWNRNNLPVIYNNIIITNLMLTVAAMFLFAVIINSMNFIDGLDGLCGGVSLIFSIVLAFYAVLTGKTYLVFIMLSLIGSLIGFLVFNFYPAKIFMGDTGSLFLGSMFSMVIMLLSYHMIESWYAYIALFTYPIMDLVLAVLRRTIAKKPLFAPDKNHIHHILMGSRTNQSAVVIFIYLINIVFAAFSILMYLFPSIIVFVSYAVFLIAIFWYSLYKMLKNYRSKDNAFGK